MIVCDTIYDVMKKHKMRPKEFSEVTGMNLGTCRQIYKGQGSVSFDVFAPWIDFGISRGISSDILRGQ